MDQTTQQLTVNVQETTLSLSNPKQIMEFGKELAKYIIANNLSVVIQNKSYCLVDGWKWAGAAFGLTAVCDEPVAIHEKMDQVYTVHALRERSSNGKTWQEEVLLFANIIQCPDRILEDFKAKNKAIKENARRHFNYKCASKIIRISDGMIISTGFATCSNLESKKIGFDEYAVNSMSQTRAIGKGFRNLLGYVMNAAGFEATPAEEMEEFADKKEPEPELPTMTEDQFGKTLDALKAGKVTLDTVKKYYRLTEDQAKQVDSLNAPPEPEKKPKKKPGPKPKNK